MNRESVIQNLIDNDVKYSAGNALVSLSYVDAAYFERIMRSGFKGYDNMTDEELIQECNDREISVLEIK